MNNNDYEKRATDIDELIHELAEVKSFEEYMQNHENEFDRTDLQTYLYELLKKTNLSIAQVIEKASISRSLAYQIFNGQRTPNRNLIIRIAIIMKLSLDETQRLLRIAKKGELYPRIRRDAAILFCIQHNLSLIDTNELLEDLGEAVLLS